MKKFLFCLLSLITVLSMAQMSFFINEPRPDAVISGNTLNINGWITYAVTPVASMIAVSNGVTDTLSFSQPGPGQFDYGYFYGSISVAGFPQNVPIKLKITGTDINGNQASDSVNYIIPIPTPPNPPAPQAFVLTPSSGTNVYPLLSIRTSHTGTDTCTSYLAVTRGGVPIFTDTSIFNDIDTTISISNLQLGALTVKLTVKDKWNQSGTASVAIFADNSPFLSLLYTGEGLIKDYNYHRILESRSDAMYMIGDTNLQVHTALPASTDITRAYSTPYGALWKSSTYGNKEFTNGSLYDAPAFTSTAGKYFVYESHYSDPAPGGEDNMLKNMETGTTVGAGGSYGSGFTIPPVVAENGLVVYSGPDAVFLASSLTGIVVYQPMGGYEEYYDPVTDGKNIVYRESNYSSSTSASETHKLYLYNGTQNIFLCDFSGYGWGQSVIVPTAGPYYSLKNGFVAYLKRESTDQTTLWFRDTTGVTRQLTTTADGYSYVGALNDRGDLIYTTSNGTFYLKYGRDSARRINNIGGALMYRDSSWYVIRGRYLYKLNVDAFRTVANGSWTDGASWENGIVPSPNADVIVTTDIIVNTNVVCNSLHVVPPGSITVAPGVTLTVLH